MPLVFIPYNSKISRVKIFEVDLPQNSSQIKFRGSTRLFIAFVCYNKIFEVAVKSTKTAKFIVLEKFLLHGNCFNIVSLAALPIIHQDLILESRHV